MRIEEVDGVLLVVLWLWLLLLLDPIDGDGRWWIVWKREVARGVDVVWIDWIEDRALRELDKRGSDAIVRVSGGIWSSYSVLWWEQECRWCGSEEVTEEDAKVEKESKVAIVRRIVCTCKGTKSTDIFHSKQIDITLFGRGTT